MEDIKGKGFSLTQIKANFTLVSWWLAIAVIPLSGRAALYFCNKTNLSPNFFTTCSFSLRLATALLFFQGEVPLYVAGAVLFYFASVFDAIDGPVARLTGQESNFGRYYDHVSDLVGDFLILAALAFGQEMLFTPLVFGILFMHIAESYISYLTNMAVVKRDAEGESSVFDNVLVRAFVRYRLFFFDRNLKSFFSFPDYSAFTFILFPVLGAPLLGLKVGFVLLLVSTLFTVLSSFVSLHTGETRFP